jgi:4-alpha-glucanotransferase
MNLLNQRTSGILLHPTSLPGPHGMGDLGPSAHHFVDWLAGAGQKLWQWLPATPVGSGNSAYQSVSAFAGGPHLIALEPLRDAGWLDLPLEQVPTFDAHAVDFDRALPWRMTQLRRAWAGFTEKATAAERDDLAAWASAQASWLDDYTLFMALEQAHDGQPWWTWPADLAAHKSAALKKARKAHAEEIGFWTFVQWCFDTQVVALKRYANERGVGLMADLPIFVAHHSADVWARPDLYILDKQFQPTVVAGAPPDPLGPEGQRWGNPLYRWDRMAREHFAWWIARVARTLHQADVFRIDHFRGFAAYWEIQADHPDARQGHWVPGPGQALFDAITQALGPVPVVAEDLGVITDDVTALREACGFPGMKVLQYAFADDATHEYLPHNATPDSVVYTGTHDTDTLRGWWDHASPAERHFAGTYLACGASDVHWAAIRAAMNSVARTVITPLQDVLGLGSEHRMNTPGTMGPHNWAWRFTWSQIGDEPGRVLGLMTRFSGR